MIESGTIKIIDLVFIAKDAEGDVVAVEFDEHEQLEGFAGLDGDVGGLISEEDIAYAGESLEPNSSAALLIWEDTWADPVGRGAPRCGGRAARGITDPARSHRARLVRGGLGQLTRPIEEGDCTCCVVDP